jgi:hypothetical protein
MHVMLERTHTDLALSTAFLKRSQEEIDMWNLHDDEWILSWYTILEIEALIEY